MTAGILQAALGDLDAVADQDVPAADAQRLGQQAKHQRGPQRGELVVLVGGGVAIIAVRIVAGRMEVQRAQVGGVSELVGGRRVAGEGGGEPQAFAGGVNAGRSDRIAFHQSIHSDIGLARCVVMNDAVTRGLTMPALNLA